MSLTTSVEPLEDNKVRLHVSIPAADFEQAIDAAFRKLAKEVKMPGFRPGKAPRRLLEARMGTEAFQLLRDALKDPKTHRPQTKTYPTELVIRQSTAEAPRSKA